MKSKIKYLIFFLILILLLNSCSILRKIYIGLGGTTFVPPRYEALVYGIVENDKVNRMGLSKIYVDKMYEINMHKMEHIIGEKYKIRFNSPTEIETYTEQSYYIKFYDDFKMTINGKEYTIPKEKIEEKENKWNDGSITVKYKCLVPVNILKTDDNEYILDIGEIEIVDKTGKIIKPKEKIPTLSFKKTVYVVLADKGIKYDGWVEDYPGGIKALRELEKYFKSVK